MEPNNDQIQEIQLAGKKLDSNTQDISIIEEYGKNLFLENEKFIKEKVPDNWFAIIDPFNALLIASPDTVTLYQYSQKRTSNMLFYFVGLIKNSFKNMYIYARRD